MYRILADQLKHPTKQVTVLLGSRQAGKTTLLQHTFPEAAYINVEASNYRELFNTRDLKKIVQTMQLAHGAEKTIWILDEVQRLEDPGLVAKVIHDEYPSIRLIISGSSALEIANKASESLAGRKKTFTLFPLTLREKLVQLNQLKIVRASGIQLPPTDTSSFIEEIKASMQFGMYPALLNVATQKEKEDYLLELADSTILKDIYYLNLVKNTQNLHALLKLLAYQIGQQVNVTELASRIGIARATVGDYIELLKKTFVIFTLPPYTKKRRDEIGKSEKVYFYDLGVRNAVINDFSPVEFRRDYGSIFENFVISELLKLNHSYRERYSQYYWRTKWGSEVDLILVRDNRHIALEVKTRKGSMSHAFKNTYPDGDEYVVTVDNTASMLV